MKHLFCITCNADLQSELYNENLMPPLVLMLLPFIIIALITAYYAVHALKDKSEEHGNLLLKPGPLVATAIILGIGTGGFADGIILHQILQFHEMVSARVSPDTVTGKSVNMFWDGIFHLFTLIIVLTGIILLWKLLKKKPAHTSGYLLTGGMLCGWAIFNLIEGILNHQILEMHNVKELSPSHGFWNWGFLAISLMLLLSGYGLIRKGKPIY